MAEQNRQNGNGNEEFRRSNNFVQLTGNLGRDPELKELDGGKKVTTFSLCTHEEFEINGEKKEDKQWHRVVAWEELADKIAEKLEKGSFIQVTGKIKNREYQDAEGVTKYVSEIVARKIVDLNKKFEYSKTKTIERT